MTKRIKFNINASGYQNNGVSWKIFRSTTPEDIIKKDNFIMEVSEDESPKELKFATRDILSKSTKDPFLFIATFRYHTEPDEPNVYIDGDLVDKESVTLYPNEREIRIVDPRLTLGNTRTITMDYWYTTNAIYDRECPPEGIDYHGPVALGLRPVENLTTTPKLDVGKTQLDWDHDTAGVEYFYQMYAQKGEKKSEDSDAVSVYLEQKSSTIQYRIERAPSPTTPDDEWDLVGYVATTDYLDEDLAADLPFWCTKDDVILEKIDEDKIRIRVPNPFVGEHKRHTYTYRVAPADECGLTEGNWQYVFPQEFKGIGKVAKIRRYRYNKLPASFDKVEDGTDIVEWTDTSITDPYFEYIDNYIDPMEELLPKEFGYTFYLQDIWEYISQPVYRAISLDTGEILE